MRSVLADVTSAQLESKRQAIVLQSLQQSQDYIWQHDAYALRLGPAPWHKKASSKSGGTKDASSRPYLWGSVRFGDNLEDEWFIAWLMKTCTER